MEATKKDNDIMAGAEPSEVERLKEEVRHEHEMYLRALADFDNYRRRVERETGEAARSGKRDIILALLEVLDGFDRAVQQASEAPSSMSVGVQVLHRKLLGLLEVQGVTPYKSLGDVFSPELQEAIGSIQSDQYESGVIVDEVQRGYRGGDEVLRPARVRVAQ
jgi:molecular chaperone GrpE